MRVLVVGSTRDIDARALEDAVKALHMAGHLVDVPSIYRGLKEFDLAEYLEQFPHDTKVALVPLWQTCPTARDIVKDLRENTDFTFITVWGGHEVLWDNSDDLGLSLGDPIPEYTGALL